MLGPRRCGSPTMPRGHRALCTATSTKLPEVWCAVAVQNTGAGGGWRGMSGQKQETPAKLGTWSEETRTEEGPILNHIFPKTGCIPGTHSVHQTGPRTQRALPCHPSAGIIACATATGLNHIFKKVLVLVVNWKKDLKFICSQFIVLYYYSVKANLSNSVFSPLVLY